MKHLRLTLLFIFLSFSLSACSSWFSIKTDRDDKTIEKPIANADSEDSVPTMSPPQATPMDDSVPLTDNIASPISENPVPENQTVDVTLNKKSYIDEKYHDPSLPTVTADELKRTETTYSGKSDGVDPDKALGWLKNGNKRFLKGSLRADGQSKKDIRRLQKSEKPHAVVFASSDSRIPPEIIFDEKLGEIYVIRNLGLTVDTSVLNSLDYAIGELGTRLVVVLDRTYPGKEIDFTHAGETMQKLVDQSVVLKAALEAKNIQVIPAIYNLNTGKVEFGK